jgi:hypothetical protein
MNYNSYCIISTKLQRTTVVEYRKFASQGHYPNAKHAHILILTGGLFNYVLLRLCFMHERQFKFILTVCNIADS